MFSGGHPTSQKKKTYKGHSGECTVHFWLHHTVYCTEKIVSAHLCAGSASAERVGQGKVGGVIRRVLCTWQLLGLAVNEPWLTTSGPIPVLVVQTGLETLLSPSFSSREGGLGSERVLPTENADYCMLINEWTLLRSRVCLVRLEVDLGSVLESELGQKWRYGA